MWKIKENEEKGPLEVIQRPFYVDMTAIENRTQNQYRDLLYLLNSLMQVAQIFLPL